MVGDYLPIADLDDPLRLLRHLAIVGHDDHRVPVGVQLVQNVRQRPAADAIQRSGGFIGENNLRAVDQRSTDADPLLLAAGKLRGFML